MWGFRLSFNSSRISWSLPNKTKDKYQIIHLPFQSNPDIFFATLRIQQPLKGNNNLMNHSKSAAEQIKCRNSRLQMLVQMIPRNLTTNLFEITLSNFYTFCLTPQISSGFPVSRTHLPHNHWKHPPSSRPKKTYYCHTI